MKENKTADIILEVQVDTEDIPTILEDIKKSFVKINSQKEVQK